MDDKSIAVLPFANMSDGNENEFFSDGLAEELLNRLSRVPDLRVAARTSSFHFKGHTGAVSEVAQQLNVATILEGSVRRAGDQVRVTAQLIKASDGFPLWSDSYDGQLDDVFGIQEQIATQVVDALKITLLGDDARRLIRRPTDNVEAYENYLLGKQRMRSRRSDELEQAVQYFQHAIDFDPGFALAYVGQAEAVGLLSQYGTLSVGEAVERVKSLLDKAMKLDDRQGEAYAVRALLSLGRNDIDGAIADLERAIELNPNHATAYMWYGVAVRPTDPERALSLFRKVLELDPLSALAHGNIGTALERLGRYEEALEGYRRAVEIDPGFAVGYEGVATLYENAFGRLDEAIHWSERAVGSDPGNVHLRLRLGARLQNHGRFDEALEVFRETIDLNPDHLSTYRAIAGLYEVRGRVDEAIRWHHAAHQRDPSNPSPLFQMAGNYALLGDEASARHWLTRLQEVEESGRLFGIALAHIHVKRGEPAKAEAILRELGGAFYLFDFDLEAGNYDAILEREVTFESEVNLGNVVRIGGQSRQRRWCRAGCCRTCGPRRPRARRAGVRGMRGTPAGVG
jgi:TolB-like protein/Flp pilus assembly protein TadD